MVVALVEIPLQVEPFLQINLVEKLRNQLLDVI